MNGLNELFRIKVILTYSNFISLCYSFNSCFAIHSLFFFFFQICRLLRLISDFLGLGKINRNFFFLTILGILKRKIPEFKKGIQIKGGKGGREITSL